MKIGVFDSGLGGVTVLRSLVARFPGHSFVYFGDTKHAPYGTRTPEDIRKLTLQGQQFLMETRGCELFVNACNTATVCAGIMPKSVGVTVPTALYAAQAVEERIGIIATPATIERGTYQEILSYARPDVEVLALATPALVPLIEAGEVESVAMKEALWEIKDTLQGIDTLILGCTHYPYVLNQLQVLFPGVAIVESGDACATQCAELINNGTGETHVEVHTSGDITQFWERLQKLDPETCSQLQSFSSALC